jgi:hypothetical protein
MAIDPAKSIPQIFINRSDVKAASVLSHMKTPENRLDI